MAFDDRPMTVHEKEQQIFSDMRFDPNGGKDFKQGALKRHQDMINGLDQKEVNEKLDDFAAMVEMAEQQFAEQREKFMHKLYGYEVSETDVRKAATNILRDYDAFAARFNLEGEDKSAVYDQILLLQKGTAEEQDQALKDLHERNPELAEAVVKEAHDLKMSPQNINSDSDAQLSSTNDQPFEHQQASYRNFGFNQGL